MGWQLSVLRGAAGPAAPQLSAPQGSLAMLRAGEAGRHHRHLLGQAAVTVNLILFALLSTGCFLRAIQNQPAQGKSGCTICLAFPTDDVLWASFVPREGAALMAPRRRDGTLRPQVWGQLSWDRRFLTSPQSLASRCWNPGGQEGKQGHT